MTTQDLEPLEKRIRFSFSNTDFLRQALVHRSYLNENPDFPLGHNERLEFLGDAVLELVVTEYLYGKYDNPEGELTNWRAALVNATMLSVVAGKIDLGDHILLSRGEARDASSKARQSILANAVEALIGAIYLDKGYAAAKQFVEEFILSELSTILEKKLYQDPKSQLQEESQARLAVTPVYRVLEEHGPDHNKQFSVGVYLGDALLAEGKGSSKQEAQVAAAAAALEVKGW